MRADLDKLLDRFMILKRTLQVAQARDVCAYFSEKELDDIVYALAELKVLKGDDLK